MSGFEIKDSGARKEYKSGMMRDRTEDKIEYWSMRIGPMYKRWATLLTKGRKKYPDVEPGVPNWTLAEGMEEYLHAKESWTRHTEAYADGQTDEDHAAAIFFNINLMEYIKEKMALAEAAAFAEGTGADPEFFVPGVVHEYATGLDENGDARPAEDQLRLREYRDRMARERAILNTPIG